ncbi:MAG: nuclease [Deltaproteobacteria bacterium]|nr:nuclease [Deltaproteobacteria bacterium]
MDVPRRMAVELKKLVLGGWLAAFVSACAVTNEAPVSYPRKEVAAVGGDLRQVVRVVDGDTLVLAPNEKVRLIGVDTPETVHPNKAVQCFGKDAKAFARALLENQTVRLVFDERYTKQNHKDKFGRTLGYVYLADGRMLNAELIRQGYAHAYTRFPFHYLAEFRDLEREARQSGAGLWSFCPLS